MTDRDKQPHDMPGDGQTRLTLTRLPERKYYAISDVAKETDLQPYVLRFWEKEFPMLRPRKSRTNNNRQYQRRDIDLIKRIKHLLYTEGYTIEGARQRLKTGTVEVVEPKTLDRAQVKAMLGELRKELQEIAAMLE